jgi:hypothetical protein
VSTIAGVGRSEAREARLAGREAGRAARLGLAGRSPNLALVFATTGYDQSVVLAGLAEELPGVPTVGCSGEGIIAGPVSDENERAVAALALASDTMRFEPFLVRDYSANPRAAGEALARQVNAAAGDDAIALVLFLEGLLGNASEMLEGLDATLARRIPVVGGAAADAQQFERTFQYAHGEVVTDGISALLIQGRGRLDFAVSHGCMPIGLERRITRADGPWVHEIDGRPAWTVFRQYLEGEPDDLNSEGMIHLSVGEALPETLSGGYEPFIIHTPLGLDRATGALFFPGGGIRTGATIRVSRRDPVRIGVSARACAERIRAHHDGRRPAFVLQFDCAGRGKQMFASRTAEHVVHPLQAVLGTDTPWIGIHTYGEIAPIGGATRYHNFTVALCAIYDRA